MPRFCLEKLRITLTLPLLLPALCLCICFPLFGLADGGSETMQEKKQHSRQASGNGYPYSIVDHLEQPQLSTRFIEPTSPILGEKLVAYIKESEESPAEVLQHLRSYGEELETDIARSCITYFNVMIPGLHQFQEDYRFDRIPTESTQWTEVEASAIPLEVLLPLHPDYAIHLSATDRYVASRPLKQVQDSARSVAQKYQTQKINCPSVINALRDDNPWKSLLPGRCRRLLEINTRVSAAESAYPRLQHSINGYVRSIYTDLCANDHLQSLLETTYQASLDWMAGLNQGAAMGDYFNYVQSRTVSQGFTTRDALLVMCYATRNMPNIDVEYASHPSEALMLEVYFWKMKELLSTIVRDHFDYIFPNHRFETNPMLYHYATAAYLAYEIRSSGYTSATAVAFAFMSKAGYKMHKYVHSLSHELVNKGGVIDMAKLMKAQRSLPGVQAGVFGGQYGAQLARKDLRQSAPRTIAGKID